MTISGSCEQCGVRVALGDAADDLIRRLEWEHLRVECEGIRR